MAKFNNQVEECVEVPKRFEAKELDHRDYLNVIAEASAARGAIKGFIGGSLMTIAYKMFITSTAKSIVKPFCAGIIGTAGIGMTVLSFDEWEDAVTDMAKYIRMRIEDKRSS